MELEAYSYLKFLLALIFVVGLIGGFGLLAKRAGLGNRGPLVKSNAKRLSIIETMALDPKRRLVLVQCDDDQHLLLLGANNEQTIENNIKPPLEAIIENESKPRSTRKNFFPIVIDKLQKKVG